MRTQRREQTSLEDCFVPTLNKMGYMATQLDVVQQKFIAYAAKSPEGVSLDLGAAFGIATLPLLERQQKIVSCDVDPRHLKAIRQAVSPTLAKNLSLKAGHFPHTARFRKNRFKAILCGMVLHFVPPREMTLWLSHLRRILRPGGKIFITVSSPYQGVLKNFIPFYRERLENGDPLPGYIENIQQFVPHRSDQLPAQNTVFCPNALERLIKDTGFNVLECFGFTRENLPLDLHYNGQAYTGLVATSP